MFIGSASPHEGNGLKNESQIKNNKNSKEDTEENILLNIVHDMAESATNNKKQDSYIMEEVSESRAVKQDIYLSNPNVDIIKRSEIPLDGEMNNIEKKDTVFNQLHSNMQKVNTNAFTLENVSDIQKLNRSKVSKTLTTRISSSDRVETKRYNNNNNFQTNNDESKQWRTTQPLYQSTLDSSHKDIPIAKDQNSETKVNILRCEKIIV